MVAEQFLEHRSAVGSDAGSFAVAASAALDERVECAASHAAP